MLEVNSNWSKYSTWLIIAKIIRKFLDYPEIIQSERLIILAKGFSMS